MNIFQKAITPDMPRVLEGEQIYVYVPQATSTNAGIASYKNTDFKVNDGVVSLRRELRDAYNIPDLVLLDEHHFPREIVEKDGNEYYKYTTNAILHIVQNLSDQQKQQARENIDAGSNSDVSKINTDLLELKSTLSKQVLSVNGKQGHVILKNSDIENDMNYVTADFVNSSIATNTATFRGTFNSLTELQEYDGHKDVNDYAFVLETDSIGNVKYNRYKYAEDKWIFEYTLNNSSFTQTQWAAINSGITDKIIELIRADITNLQNDKVDKTAIDTLRADITNLQNDKVDKTITINNKSLSSNIVLVPTDIGAYSQEAGDNLTKKVDTNTENIKTASSIATDAKELAQQALNQVVQGTGTQVKVNGTVVSMFDADTKADLNYVDEQIAALIGTAPETLNTLEEIAKAIEENETVVDALNSAIGAKANKADIEPTIQFAEVERQKSKNLFNINKLAFKNYDRLYINKKDGIITFDNLANASTSKVLLKDFTDLKVGKTYVLSFETTSSLKFIYLNGSGISWYNGTTHTITQAELDGGIHMYGSTEGINTIKNIQIEEGTIVTEYQPYRGAVTRNGDAPVVFAESERQKSANIFDYRLQPNVTYVTNNQDGSFTIANMSFYYPSWNMVVNLKPNTTYTFSETVVSVSDSDGLEANGVALDVVVFYTDNTYSSGTQYVYGPGRVAVTVSIFNKPIKNVEFRALRKNNNTSTLNGVIKDICVQEGIDTNYYPLTGPIIHEEELKEYLKDYISTSTPVLLATDKTVVFAEEERQKTKNLFDKTAVLRDHELNGSLGVNSANTSYYVSDYIYVKGISNLYLSSTGKTSGKSNCFYDANRNYISTYSQLEGSIPVPSNAVYMRFNGLITELNNDIQLEEGTSASPYQSYNGNITHDITVDSFKRLPNTYQEVEYIESTGTQYINTGVIGKTGVGAEVSLMFTEVPSDGAILGCRKDDTHICPFHIYPSKWWYGYGNSNSNAKLAASANIPYYAYSVLKNGEQTLRVNDTPVALSGTSTTDINTSVNMYIFAMNKNNSEVIYPSKFKLYMLRIYEGNTMVRDYIPCYRKSDGVAGLYDAVNNKFYTNAGTGSFLIGPSNISKVLSNENPECFNSGLKIIKTGSVLDRTGSKDASIYCERRDTGVACHFGVGSGGTNHGFFSLPLNRWILYANKTSSYLTVNEINLLV